MKCVVLAGGKGDRLWPLSRRSYPKQFMNIKEDRSLLQETISRNMSLCEEFFIMANSEHGFIVERQMEVFQGLKYRCFYEEQECGTAFPVILAALSCNSSELIYVINADHMISGVGYRNEVIQAMDIARKGEVATFVAEYTDHRENYDFFRVDEAYKPMKFVSSNELKKYTESEQKFTKKELCINTGLFVVTAGDLLRIVQEYDIDYYKKCVDVVSKLVTTSRHINISMDMTKEIERKSIEQILYNDLNGTKLLMPSFCWMAVDSFDIFDKYEFNHYDSNVISDNCDDVTVINQDKTKMVVVNGINDAFVVNTADAVYVTRKDTSLQIKDIAENSSRDIMSFFEKSYISYMPWGYREILITETNFMVGKVVVFPGKAMNMHSHASRSENWSIVEGNAIALIGEQSISVSKEMSLFIPTGTKHSIINDSEENVVIIEVTTGDNLVELDVIKDKEIKEKDIYSLKGNLIKLEPTFKDYIWGGDKLRRIYRKNCDYDRIAESWELSAHGAGSSVVASGRFKGRTFSDYLSMIDNEGIGWKSEGNSCFPILIKLIDAKENLSIQVHPDDEYALKNEQELGKNEMWYIMECEENAYLYCGFSCDTTKEEILRRIENDTILDILNKVHVHKGDVVFVPAGTVHAIGKGIIICEIQQNSNSTYRLYDYGRKDKFGNTRELHIQKALDVISMKKYDISTLEMLEHSKLIEYEGYVVESIAECKYFQCLRYIIDEKAKILIDDASFKSFMIMEGDGIITDGNNTFDFQKGDSFFMPAGMKKVEIIGKSVILVTHI